MPGLKRALMAALLVLAGCGQQAVVVPPPAEGLRNTKVDVYAMAGFNPTRLAGTWREVASRGGCTGGGLTVTVQGTVLLLDGALCSNGQLAKVSGPVQMTRNGRLQGPALAEDLVVIWADYDDRTVVLADLAGKRVSVLDRGVISADRLKAARQMLSYNGYPAEAVK